MTDQRPVMIRAGRDDADSHAPLLPFATQPAAAVPEGPPPDQEARDAIRDDLAATLFVEAGAGAGKTSSLVDRVVSLVRAGVPITEIAAITFTERAAADLRHRLRIRLNDEAERPNQTTDRLGLATATLDAAPIGTIHGFCRRVLVDHPVDAGVPPGFAVLDELESHIAFDERWADFVDSIVDDATTEFAPGLTSADFLELCSLGTFGGVRGLRNVALEFQANWDLVEQRVAADASAQPVLDIDPFVAELDAIVSTPVPAGDKQEAKLADFADLRAALERASTPVQALSTLGPITGWKFSKIGNRANWKGSFSVADLDDLRGAETALSEHAARLVEQWRSYRESVVGSVLRRFTVDGATARAGAGTLDFHDLLVLTRQLLATNVAARTNLHRRYTHILLDESQDTDPVQLEITRRLAADPAAQSQHDVPVPLPGRLFVVGDPKQSIYRFRRADIGVYLRAADEIGARKETLNANFRSSEPVIKWINGVFGSVIEKGETQAPFQALERCRPAPWDHGSVRVLGVDEHEPVDPDATKITAQALRGRESDDVAKAILVALDEGWPVHDHQGLRPCRASDITVLLPTRMSLPQLEVAFARSSIPYRAENAAIVYAASEVRNLMLAVRSLSDPTDALALTSALRSSLFGCSDVELYDWRAGGGSWNVNAPIPDGLRDHPIAEIFDYMRTLARRASAMAPADLLTTLIDDRRVLETAMAGADARDVWRRVRFLVDQARAWSDAGGRGVRAYLGWAALQASESRASDSILPETDHDAVRVMTVHAAKGLEFPITIVAGLTTALKTARTTSVVWPDGRWGLAEQGSEMFEEFKPLDEQMSDEERRRLLYVACTRAVDHLVVSLHRCPAPRHGKPAAQPSSWLLHENGASHFGARELTGSAPPVPVGAETLELEWAEHDEWAAERARAFVRGRIRSATSATRVAEALATVAPSADEGLDKEPVDLDLPPWQRGRYGTAIGRAVHAVLQDADLVTGADIGQLADQHAAAEGIFDHVDTIGALARSALEAPIVKDTAATQHWRELFVVCQLGDTVLEGYIDLLVRTPDGLVIVDYKTDRFSHTAERAIRIARYRLQLAAYGVALEQLLHEPIVGGVLVHCHSDKPADQIDLADWRDACDTVTTSEGAQ